ncbi:MAG: YeeE/YedE thiosulfate transporter family protein [Spirochaetia bacterium]|nr:YeeE/YedE thiosulfate transporter family protein [Spirochaetia bacterium]
MRVCAVIAGGCASGTLMRVGEGFMMQWLSIIFFIIGSVIGVAIYPLWKPLLQSGSAVYLPRVLGGWLPALILQFALLLGLYILADWWKTKKPQKANRHKPITNSNNSDGMHHSVAVCSCEISAFFITRQSSQYYSTFA